MKTVRTRIAPSPTGYVHLGNLKGILIDYALAKKHGGQFIWRNEDTDQQRFVEGALEYNMRWVREFGLDWDEGPDKGGPYAPYTQTERLDLYKEAEKKLIENDYAYRCFCTKERLDELRTLQQDLKQRTHYDGRCRNLNEQEIQKNLDESKAYTVRIKVPKDRELSFTDVITHNVVKWKSEDVDDYIIIKSNGIPTYHLAAMYDDILMEISHIFRGSEWLSTTPVHLLIFEGLGVKEEDRPQIGHFTVILDPNTPGKKFSKRNSAFRINGLVVQGYLKEAILNYLMLLGWAPKDNRELFTLEEFIEAFDLEGMQKANPTWDPRKMDWFNGQYIRKLNKSELREKFAEWIEKYLFGEDEATLVEFFVKEDFSEADLKKILIFAKEIVKADKGLLESQLALVQERMINFFDALKQLQFFYNQPKNIDFNIKQLKKVEGKTGEILKALLELHEGFEEDSSKWTHEKWEEGIRAIGDKHEAKHGDVFMTLRMAVVGSPFSPPLFESLQLLGKDEIIDRIKSAQ